jgi:phosphatidylserine/phosphatidylglycerophosphate/cardiolipin synthase-like enzyme
MAVNPEGKAAKRGLRVLLMVACCCLPACQQGPGDVPPVEVYFSPRGGCTEAVVRELDAAKESVLVQAYSFTSAPIAKALVQAHNRGVTVEVILDESQQTEKYSDADFLHNMGIPTRIDAKHAIAHNKIIVIDEQVVITGSFNFTRAAEEHNAENLLVIRDGALAEKYTANWQTHAAHSDPYKGRGDGGAPAEKKPAKYRAGKPQASGAIGLPALDHSPIPVP